MQDLGIENSTFKKPLENTDINKKCLMAGPGGRAVFGRSATRIVGSNPTQSIDV